MSIARNALAETAIGADPAPAGSTSRPPAKRTVIAEPDSIQQPEAR